MGHLGIKGFPLFGPIFGPIFGPTFRAHFGPQFWWSVAVKGGGGWQVGRWCSGVALVVSSSLWSVCVLEQGGGGCQRGGNRTLRVWGCLGGRMCECCNLPLPGHALCA